MSIPWKKIWRFAQIPVFILLIFTVFRKFDLDKIQSMNREFSGHIHSSQSIFWLLICLSALALHMAIESYKWKILIQELRPRTTIIESLSMVLRGLSTSLVSPNRTGEFVGRVYKLDQSQRIRGSILSGISSFTQMMATFIFGLCSMIYMQYRYAIVSLPENSIWLSISIAILLLGVTLALIKKDSWLKNKRIEKLISHFEILKTIPVTRYIFLSVLSILRYSLFLVQLYSIFRALDIQISFVDVLIAQSCLYFTLSFIPHNALVDISLRGALSLYFFHFFGVDSSLILIGAYFLYFINLLLPASLGLLFYLPSRYRRVPILLKR